MGSSKQLLAYRNGFNTPVNIMFRDFTFLFNSFQLKRKNALWSRSLNPFFMFNSSRWFILIYLQIIPEFSAGFSFLSHYNALARHPKSLSSARRMPELPCLHCSFHGVSWRPGQQEPDSTPQAQPSWQGPGSPRATSGVFWGTAMLTLPKRAQSLMSGPSPTPCLWTQ